MEKVSFSFTPEQKANLENWRVRLDTEQAREWAAKEERAIGTVKDIFQQAGFEQGNDLSPNELDDTFTNMRSLIYNRALNRKLYEDNGLSNFNTKLRTLLFGSSPLPERVNQFFELKRVGILTLSHFLCAFSPTEYPEIGWQTFDVLELDSTQLDDAYEQALSTHNISPLDYRGNTIEYLRDMIIFKEIGSLLHIKEYNLINDLLWLIRQGIEDDVQPSTTSVSLENDLRNFLADNTQRLEKGLSVIGKEYDISGAGRVDLLCKDTRGYYVVIETKKGRESDKVVGQILRYIGGLKKDGKKARGIIIVNEPDERLDFAVEAVKDFIKLKYYKVKFEITDSYTKQ